MREIKFRAWDKKQGLLLDVVDMQFFTGKSPAGNQNIHLATAKFSGVWDNFILMQYTGLKDKNGKEIYEGDIVLYEKPRGGKITCKVYFGAGCYMLKTIKGLALNRPEISFKGIKSIEIIGNVYENPKLLSAGIGSE